MAKKNGNGSRPIAAKVVIVNSKYHQDIFDVIGQIAALTKHSATQIVVDALWDALPCRLHEARKVACHRQRLCEMPVDSVTVQE